MEGQFNMKIIENVAGHLAKVHQQTHISILSSDDFAQLCAEFMYVTYLFMIIL